MAFESTRREAHEVLYFNRNVFKDWKPDKIDLAETVFRQMAARIAAVWASSSWLVRRYFQLRGWDLAAASSGFYGLSNVHGTTREERTILCHEVELALGLPPKETAERIGRLRKRGDERED